MIRCCQYLDYVASHGRKISELEKIWKEEVMANQVTILELAWSEGGKPQKPGIPAKIQTDSLIYEPRVLPLCQPARNPPPNIKIP
jgi:hypothetical protein